MLAMTPGRVALCLLCLLAARPVAAQPATPPGGTSRSAAMYEFLLARRAEARDDLKAAQAGLERAVALDPTSAELHAELAGFFARQNKAEDAVREANAALALDAESEEAHRILGLVNAAWADGVVDGPKGGSEETWRAAAIEHLTKVQNAPATATDLGAQLTLARQLLAAERPGDAVPILERIVSQTGPAGEPVSMLADALRTTGQLERAEAVLEQAAEANPRYYVALGDVYERQEKFEQAADAFDRGAKALRTPGRELPLRRVNALLSMPGGKGVEPAIAALTEYLARAPKDAVAHFLMARAQFARGDEAAGEKAAKDALAIDARHVPTLSLIAEHYRDRYDYAAIDALLGGLAEGDGAKGLAPPEAVRLLAELGGARQQLGDAEGAVRAFRRAREAMPESAPLVAALAQAEMLARRPVEAAKLAREARTQHAGDLGLIRVEALANIKAGRAAQAVADAENGIGGRRTSLAGALALADVYQEARRFGDAIALLTPLSTEHPDDVLIAFRLSSAYDAANRPADAEKLLRGIIAGDPLHAGALNYLGYMLANRGQKLPDALALIDRALAVEPGNPAYLDSRGWALFKMGRTTEAEAPLRQAATALRGNSVIQSHFADVLAALGKRDEAAERLDLALKGDLADVDAAALEKRLQQLRRRAR